MSNGAGNPGNKALDFALFDRLPQPVKELLHGAWSNIDAANVALIQKRHRYDDSELYVAVKRLLEVRQREDTGRAYGYDHPGAGPKPRSIWDEAYGDA